MVLYKKRISFRKTGTVISSAPQNSEVIQGNVLVLQGGQHCIWNTSLFSLQFKSCCGKGQGCQLEIQLTTNHPSNRFASGWEWHYIHRHPEWLNGVAREMLTHRVVSHENVKSYKWYVSQHVLGLDISYYYCRFKCIS